MQPYAKYLYDMQVKDTMELAWTTVKINKLRSGITLAIIALGIMALIGIITAIEAMNQSLRESFSTMGANSFSIRYKARNFFGGGHNESRKVTKTNKGSLKERSSNTDRIITYNQAVAFKKFFEFPATVSISVRGGTNEVIQFITEGKTFKTNPNVVMHGGDENYLELNGYKLAGGRNFNELDVSSGRAVAVLGYEVMSKCFGGNVQNALGKTVKISDRPYLVIGVLEQKGASAFLNLDNIVMSTYSNIRRLPTAGRNFSIGVMANDFSLVEDAVGQATGVFRTVRKLEVEEADNFSIDKRDALAEQFIGFLSGISGAAGVIGFITLIGAAIGLMNIMLVAVSERTREIGLSKALGATKKDIRQQFLYESVIISLLGASIGIVLGVLVGNIFGIILKTSFLVPWLWVILGVVICFITGLAAGIYPAGQAAKLDPINALRYE